ncbi:MAG: OmpH family outer membrane protein [Acidobacteria bacterium]|nr:OmpH family outer membrane protein [Acidobacteriota bacterium]
MRNRAYAIFVSFALLTSPLLLAGQSSVPSGAGGKVAVINIQDAILSTAEGKKAMQDLQSKYMPRQQEIQRRQQEVQQLQEQLQKQMMTLSDSEQRRMSRELEEKQKILRRMTEDAQSDFQNDRDDLMRRIGQKMIKVIDQYASQNGYSLVIDSGQVPVYYAGKGVNITPEIVNLYNSENPVQAASSATGGGSADAGAPAKASPKPKR